MNGFFRFQSNFDLFSSLHLFLFRNWAMPPSIFWTPLLAKPPLFGSTPFSSSPQLRGAARLRSYLQLLAVRWSMQGGNPTKIPQVANGENEWFGFFGGWGSYYTQTSRILWVGFWRSIATHNQDPTWNIIVENPPQIGGIFWGGKTPLAKMPFGWFTDNDS